MATLARMMVQIGVTLEGSLKVEGRIKGLRKSTERFADQANRNMGKVRKAFRSMGRAAARAGQKIRASLDSAIKRMGGMRNVALAGAAGIAAAAVATFKFVDSQTANIDTLNKTAQSIGINIEEYQRLRFAASQSGVDLGTLDKGIKTLNNNLLDMSKGGGKKSRDALDDLGLSLDQLQGRSRFEQLQLIATGLEGVDDSGRKAALAASLFGSKAGPQLSILLAEGAEGMAALAGQAQGVFTQEDADRATAFQDRMGEVKNVLAGLTTDLALELLPAVSDVIVGFRDWITENQNLISQGMEFVIGAISDAFFVLSTAVEAAIFPLREIASLFGEAGDSAAFLKGTIADMVTPFRVAARAITALTNALLDFGIISSRIEGTSFSTALSTVTSKVREIGGNIQGPGGDFQTGGRGTRVKPKRGGGGGKAKKSKKDKPFDARKLSKSLDKPSGITVDEAIQALLEGDNVEVLSERLKGMAASTPSTASIKPTVAIDFFNFEVTQNIESTDPLRAGQESAAAIKREFRRATAKAGQALASNMVR